MSTETKPLSLPGREGINSPTFVQAISAASLEPSSEVWFLGKESRAPTSNINAVPFNRFPADVIGRQGVKGDMIAIAVVRKLWRVFGRTSFCRNIHHLHLTTYIHLPIPLVILPQTYPGSYFFRCSFHLPKVYYFIGPLLIYVQDR